MFVLDLFLALAIAVTVGLAFWFLLGQRGPWDSLLWLLLVLFFGTWALGALLRPVGPALGEIYWVPYLIAAVVIALLLAAAGPATGPQPRRADVEQAAGEAAATVSVFFWIMLLLAIAVIVLRYSWPGVLP